MSASASTSSGSNFRPRLGVEMTGAAGSSTNIRSIPPSRTASFMPPSRSSTPGYPSSIASSSQALPLSQQSQSVESSRSLSSSHSQSHHHHSGLSKLKHMFDTQKHAIFEAHVTIHELGNVPQLQGEFDVKWKFRGKGPKGKELLDLHKHEPLPKPSLPNLKLGSSMQNSSSSVSVRSTSTTSSGAYPPTPRSLLTPSGSSLPVKSLSLPPSRDFLDRPDKRGSDSTPLKQVIAPMPSPEADRTSPNGPVESPRQIVDEPEGMDDDSASQSHSRDTSVSSRQSTPLTGVPPMINVHRPSLQVSVPSSRDTSGVSTPTERLSVPFPRNTPAVRSGTMPSYSTLLDPLPNSAEKRVSLNRTISMATTASVNSVTSSTPHTAMRRVRSSSGPGPRQRRSDPHVGVHSDARKGTTPSRPLCSHTCKFEYELNHTLRIPLNRPSSTTTPTGYPYRPQSTAALPVLGGGPQSESSLRLVIESLPSAHSHASAVAAGVQNAVDSTLAMTTHLDKKQESSSDAGHRRENKEKTIFGIVDVDLAPFASKGTMTRRFLLRGSRTNATIKLSVELSWVGGEQSWTAPPMQEGHHVARVGDFMSNDATEAMRSDLGLVKTPSNSSSGGSSLGLERTRTNYSAISSIYASRNHSTSSLGASLPTHQYQSYEHHLLKADASPQTPRRGRNGVDGQNSAHASPANSNASRERSVSPASGGNTPMKNGRSFGGGNALTPSPLILSLSKVHHHHRHHTHHLRGHGRVPSRSGIYDLPPEVIIESIFNPHPASVEGPFTYIPQGPGYDELAGEQEVMAKVVKDAGGELDEGDGTGAESPVHGNGESKENGNGRSKLGWRMRGRKDKKGRSRTDSGDKGVSVSVQ